MTEIDPDKAEDTETVDTERNSPVGTTQTPAQKLAAAELLRKQLAAQHTRINHGQ